MTAEELRQLLTISGWECRVHRAEVVLRTCYFCGNEKGNLELNAAKGIFHAWCCKKGGRLTELLRTLTGHEHHIPVQRGEKSVAPAAVVAPGEFKALPVAEVGSAARYLALRGIPPEVAAQYGVVVCVEPKHRLEGRIAFPSKDFWSGELVGWIGRSYTGKIPKYLSTLTRKVITGWRTRDKMTPAVVVEGPLDGLAVHRAGFQAVVLSGTGDAGVVEWAARLAPGVPVAIMLDGSAQQQAYRLYWQLAPLRAPLVIVGLAFEQDPASLGVEGAGDAVRQALSHAGGTASSDPTPARER